MIKLGIVGTGGMANMHALSFKQIEGVQIVAACDIEEERVESFSRKHDIPATFTSLQAMLSQADIDAVSIITPDSTHAVLSRQAIAAGKHVLCEKPLATNAADAEEMAMAAKAAGVINMVNFSYRRSSAWQRAGEMIRNGEIGKIHHFQAHYLQSWLSSTHWGDWKELPQWLWRLSTSHGSHGALGDLGVHLIDFATDPVGRATKLFCHLKAFDKHPGGKIGDYVLDANDTALISMECSNRATGTLSITRWATGHVNSIALSVFGDRGAVRLDLDKSYEMLEICRLDSTGVAQPWESINCGKSINIYERFVRCLQTGIQEQPDFARGAEVQRILDACHESAQKGRLIEVN